MSGSSLYIIDLLGCMGPKLHHQCKTAANISRVSEIYMLSLTPYKYENKMEIVGGKLKGLNPAIKVLQYQVK